MAFYVLQHGWYKQNNSCALFLAFESDMDVW